MEAARRQHGGECHHVMHGVKNHDSQQFLMALSVLPAMPAAAIAELILDQVVPYSRTARMMKAICGWGWGWDRQAGVVSSNPCVWGILGCCWGEQKMAVYSWAVGWQCERL